MRKAILILMFLLFLLIFIPTSLAYWNNNSVCAIWDCTDTSWTIRFDSFTRPNNATVGATEDVNEQTWTETSGTHDIFNYALKSSAGGAAKTELTGGGTFTTENWKIVVEINCTDGGSHVAPTAGGTLIASTRWWYDCSKVYFQNTTGNYDSGVRIKLGEVHMLELEYNESDNRWRAKIDNSDTYYTATGNGWTSYTASASAFNELELEGYDISSASEIHWDNLIIFNTSDEQLADPTPPTIDAIYCQSCTSDDTPDQQPYETTDTTPTFNITTNEDANCAIANVDLNYTGMTSGGNSYRNCTNTGGQQHNCTLHPNDALILNETDHVYIGCRDTSLNENSTSTSGPLEMSMTTSEVETEGESAIQAGIDTSVISGATVYSNQQVYLRDLNNNQVTGTFDKLVSYGNQRWAFNYITTGESLISGLFNITPAFYAAEYQEMTFQDINDSVRILINSTKT